MPHEKYGAQAAYDKRDANGCAFECRPSANQKPFPVSTKQTNANLLPVLVSRKTQDAG